jgi:hypothetical protein
MAGLTTCSWCGNDAGEMIGPRPCSFCRENMSKGVAVIITAEDDPAFSNFFEVKDTFSHMGKYLNHWFVVSKKHTKKFLKKNMDSMTKKEIDALLKKGFMWVRETEDNSILNVFPEKFRIFEHKKEI